MPLNMNTVGTGTGITGSSSDKIAIANIKSKTIDHSQVLEASRVTFSTNAMGSIPKAGYFVGNHGTYFYSRIPNTTKYYYDIYRNQIPINSNSTTNVSKFTKTKIVDKTAAFPTILNGCLYYNTGSYNFDGYLYKMNLDGDGSSTQLIPNKLGSYYSPVYVNTWPTVFATSYKTINNSSYILYQHDTPTSSDCSYPSSRFTLIEDNETTGGSVVITSQPADLNHQGHGLLSSSTGLTRFISAHTLGIYDINIDEEFVNVYICTSYTTSTGKIFIDKVLMKISKDTCVLTLTLISSDVVADKVKSTGFMDIITISSKTSETQLIVSEVRDMSYSSSGSEYIYYFDSVVLVNMSEDPSYKVLTVTPNYSTNKTSANFPSNTGKYDSITIDALSYYQGSYRPVLFYWNTNQLLTIGDVDADLISLSKNIERVVTIYLYSGDVVGSDSTIVSYEYNGELVSVNLNKLKIVNDGVYTFHIESDVTDPECIIYTKEGTILGCNITFIDDTHISGYFSKGMMINGVKTTSSGYQTITGTFNGRVSISK